MGFFELALVAFQRFLLDRLLALPFRPSTLPFMLETVFFAARATFRPTVLASPSTPGPRFLRFATLSLPFSTRGRADISGHSYSSVRIHPGECEAAALRENPYRTGHRDRCDTRDH